MDFQEISFIVIRILVQFSYAFDSISPIVLKVNFVTGQILFIDQMHKNDFLLIFLNAATYW